MSVPPKEQNDLIWSDDRGRSWRNPSPLAAIGSLLRNWSLIYNLSRREVLGRYQASIMGVLWSFITPALMLAVYTFFFGVVFKARWPRMGDSNAEFALILFSGLLVYNLFSECVTRAPSLVVANSNFVKKVVFPLEILPWVNLASGLFHAFVTFLVWLLFYTMFMGLPHWTVILAPIAVLPLLILILGLSWLLSSLGVFLRDIGQLVIPITAALLFLSPIFYPLEILSGPMRAIIGASPLTHAVEAVRGTLMWGESIDWDVWLGYLIIALAVAFLSFAWFQKTKKGFADVL